MMEFAGLCVNRPRREDIFETDPWRGGGGLDKTQVLN